MLFCPCNTFDNRCCRMPAHKVFRQVSDACAKQHVWRSPGDISSRDAAQPQALHILELSTLPFPRLGMRQTLRPRLTYVPCQFSTTAHSTQQADSTAIPAAVLQHTHMYRMIRLQRPSALHNDCNNCRLASAQFEHTLCIPL